VDDEEALRGLLVRELRSAGYATLEAGSVAEARRILERETPDMVLLDVNMPQESGFTLLRELASTDCRTAVVMLTSEGSLPTAETALELGAYDYVAKPFRVDDVLIALANARRRRRDEEAHRARYAQLAHTLVDHSEALGAARARLDRAHGETVTRLARALELRDGDTGAHIDRISRSVTFLLRRTGLSGPESDTIPMTAPLHDVGKIAVPDAILRKPGTLEPDELTQMRRHAEIGWRLLADSGSDLLDSAAEIAWTHHERWDGSGYPRGLAGSDIPLGGRLTAVCDVFDALTHDRPYRAAIPPDEAVALIADGRGKHFDPEICDCFLDVVHDVLASDGRPGRGAGPSVAPSNARFDLT
jgi:putative two-component system response regulator